MNYSVDWDGPGERGRSPLDDAIDALLAFRHGDKEHLTQDHAAMIYEALAGNRKYFVKG